MSSVTLSRRWVNLGLFATFFVLAVVAYGWTATFPSPLLPGYPGSAMFPRLVLITMGVISFFGIVRVFITGGGVSGQGSVSIPIVPFLLCVAVLLAFALVLRLAGMEIAVFAMIAGCLWFRTRRILLSVVAGVVSVAVVYLVFVQALSVGMPMLFLPRYMMGF